MKGTKINLAFGTEVIYEDADFYIDTHDKVGIVGETAPEKLPCSTCCCMNRN